MILPGVSRIPSHRLRKSSSVTGSVGVSVRAYVQASCGCCRLLAVVVGGGVMDVGVMDVGVMVVRLWCDLDCLCRLSRFLTISPMQSMSSKTIIFLSNVLLLCMLLQW